jgi:hypothetical protein
MTDGPSLPTHSSSSIDLFLRSRLKLLMDRFTACFAIRILSWKRRNYPDPNQMPVACETVIGYKRAPPKSWP